MKVRVWIDCEETSVVGRQVDTPTKVLSLALISVIRYETTTYSAMINSLRGWEIILMTPTYRRWVHFIFCVVIFFVILCVLTQSSRTARRRSLFNRVWRRTHNISVDPSSGRCRVSIWSLSLSVSVSRFSLTHHHPLHYLDLLDSMSMKFIIANSLSIGSFARAAITS